PTSRWRAGWGMAIAVVIVSAAVLGTRFLLRSESNPAVVFDVTAPGGARIDVGDPLSPDGRTVAFIAAAENGPSQIWIRPLDSQTVRALPGTQQAQRLFWSPDGQWIGYFAQGKVAKISITGGPPFVIGNEGSRDGAWGREDDILIGGQRGKPVLRISGS